MSHILMLVFTTFAIGTIPDLAACRGPVRYDVSNQGHVGLEYVAQWRTYDCTAGGN
jgi:hypothetical protein